MINKLLNRFNIESLQSISYRIKIIYFTSVIFLALPSIIYIFDNKCNFYTDYLFCESSPNFLFKNLNFVYLLGVLAVLNISYYKLIKKNLFFSRESKIVLLFLFFLIYPFGSTDVHYYRGLAKSEIYENINPYNGGFTKSIDRLDMNTLVSNPVMYSPLWLELNKIIYRISPFNEDISLYIYKLFSLCVFCLIYILLKKYFSYKIANIFILNPLLLFELIANIHLDIYLFFLTVIGLILLKNKKYFWAVLVLLLTSLFKINFLIMSCFVFLYLLLSSKIAPLKKIYIIIFPIILTVVIYLILYKNYWIGLQTFAGLKNQSDWSYNSIFERLAFSEINPLKYFKNGQYMGKSFGYYNKFLILLSGGVFLYHLIKNKFFINSNYKKMNLNSLYFYCAFVNFLLAAVVLRAFFPWYLSWVLVFILITKIQNKNKLLFLITSSIMLYYPFIYLIGHFETDFINPVYNIMVSLEAILFILILGIFIKTRITFSKKPVTDNTI